MGSIKMTRSMATFQSLPEQIHFLIFDEVPIRDLVTLSVTNSHFYGLAMAFIFDKVIIVTSRFKATNSRDYQYKFVSNWDGAFLILKSSPISLQLACSKAQYIKRILIYDDVNGLITNWNDFTFDQLTYKSSTQHIFSTSSLNTIQPHITTLALNLVKSSSVSVLGQAIKLSGIKILSRIEHLQILTNNYHRLYKFSKLVTSSLESHSIPRLKASSLVIKTYAFDERFIANYFPAAHAPTKSECQFMSLDDWIDIGSLRHLEMWVKYDGDSTALTLRTFATLYGIFVNYRCSPDNHNDLIKTIKSDYSIYDASYAKTLVEILTDPNRHFVTKKYSNLQKLGISIVGPEDVAVQNMIYHFIMDNPTISNFSISYDIRSLPIDRPSPQQSFEWLQRFFHDVLPQLRYYEDTRYVHRFNSKIRNALFRKCYTEAFDSSLMPNNALNVLDMILDDFNCMRSEDHFLSGVTQFPNDNIGLSTLWLKTVDYDYDVYVSKVPRHTRMAMVTKFAEFLAEELTSRLHLDTSILQPSLHLRLSNIGFNIAFGEFICAI